MHNAYTNYIENFLILYILAYCFDWDSISYEKYIFI